MLDIFRKKNNRWRSGLIIAESYAIKTDENYLSLKRSSELSRHHSFTHFWMRLSRLYQPHRLFCFLLVSGVWLFMPKMTLVKDSKKIEKIKMAATKIWYTNLVNYAWIFRAIIFLIWLSHKMTWTSRLVDSI